ncbi:MAG: universal stress protein [Sulfuritalea sp.]|jgi:hypothetical protein|nr:universal stress protein [Sulfuritalea sp.]
MSIYQRILLPIFSQGQSDILLHKVTELAQRQTTQLLVVRVLDTSSVEPDGPAASLPGEIMSRRAPGLLRRLDLQLARSNLSWAEARVVWGEPQAVLAKVIRAWKPDLVVTCESHLPEELVQGADILKVGRYGIVRRVADSLRHFAFQHA